mgnify:CR=1 FL=1
MAGVAAWFAVTGQPSANPRGNWLREADLVCIKVEGPHTSPMYDPFSHLVFAARSSDVRHVVIDGRVVVRNREIQTLDRERIETQAREFSESISAS